MVVVTLPAPDDPTTNPTTTPPRRPHGSTMTVSQGDGACADIHRSVYVHKVSATLLEHTQTYKAHARNFRTEPTVAQERQRANRAPSALPAGRQGDDNQDEN